jgi:molybdate transport system regulatory protein
MAMRITPDTATLGLRIDFPNGHRLGPGKVGLLEAIEEAGSISGAGRQLGMSYRRAWLLVDEMNGMFGAPLVDAQHGGSRGGGARLTARGCEVVAHYRAIELKALKAGALHFDVLKSWAAEGKDRQERN